MKKTLIIIIFTALVSISIVFMTPKRANAEETQEITPFYGGDILDGAELYLFEDYTETPNFENGYLSKKTISSQDIYYSNSVATHFNGWYKDLGMSLIDDYTTEETAYFWFYIPFNDLLARYFQLALVVSTPFEGDYVLKYKSENPQTILTSGDMSRFLLMSDQGNKYIEWFAFQVYYPDYLSSFRPLTAQLAYQFGYDSGEYEGFNSGYSSGQSYGYSQGYEQGLEDAQTYGYSTLIDFNQQIRNGNFADQSGWALNITGYSSLTISNNVCNVELTQETNQPYVLGIRPTYSLAFPNGHKIFISMETKTNKTRNVKLDPNGTFTLSDRVFSCNANEWTKKRWIATGTGTTQTIWIYTDSGDINEIGDNIQFQNIMAIDLTRIFGEGNEPTLEECKVLFPSSYYGYTQSTPTSINYLDGYNEGLHVGYTKGANSESTKQLTATGWIQNIFTGLGSLLSLQIFPGVTIGLIVGIPFIISLAYFVIRAFRGGGGA